MTQPASPPHEPASASVATLSTVRAARAVAVGGVLALIALILAWELWLAPLRPGGSWLVIKALPLLLPLPGLLRHRMITYRWLALFIWLYFVEGVVRAAGDRPPGNTLAVVQVLLVLVVFAACVLHIRTRQRAARAAQGGSAG